MNYKKIRNEANTFFMAQFMKNKGQKLKCNISHIRNQILHIQCYCQDFFQAGLSSHCSDLFSVYFTEQQTENISYSVQ